MDERRDDWQRGVDENLASLNAGQRVFDREMARAWKAIMENDRALRGDTENETDGLIARLHHQETEINLLRAVLLNDAAGGKGLAGRVAALETGERTSDNRWKFATAVVVAIISLGGLIFTNWGRIDAFFSPHKEPHKVRRHHVVIQHPAEPEDPQED